MLTCPECGAHASVGGDRQCIKCGSFLTPRAVGTEPRPAARTSAARRADRWLRANTPSWARIRSTLRKAGMVLAIIAAVAISCYWVTGHRLRKKGFPVTAENAVSMIRAENGFARPRVLWVPQQATIAPDPTWLATSRMTRTVSAGAVPLEQRLTIIGPFRKEYNLQEYEVACPSILLLKQLGLADYEDSTKQYYYSYPEKRTEKRVIKALGGPGGIMDVQIPVDVVYTLWAHDIRVCLSDKGIRLAAEWQEDPARLLHDVKWFPYDPENINATEITDRDSNVRRTFSAGWVIPLASREIDQLTDLRMFDGDHGQIEFTWRWKLTDVGTAFLAGGQAAQLLSPTVKKFVESPTVSMVGGESLGSGDARIEYREGRWQVSTLDIENPR
jgi:hypothetical protein